MQLVVEISEDTFFDLKKKQNRTEVDNAVLNGTPLPKGHGKLVDIDLLRNQVSHDEREAFSKHQVWLLLSVHNKNIQTILDADEAYKNRVIGVDLNHAEE